jgi:PAS domain-containing protein
MGYQKHEALGHNRRFLQGEDTDPERVAAVREAIDNEEPTTVELGSYRKDGTELWNRLAVDTSILTADCERVPHEFTASKRTKRPSHRGSDRAE